ncbi:hypothetical protein [Actinoplanes sp. NPDC026623]|uniref:hypothetical protein n=1 Tax=Actinoplanes sp. NPDC026623 TaxID=3155610 RepID=UPI00340EF536
MRRLTEDEYKATTVPEKERAGLDQEPPFDCWDLRPPGPRAPSAGPNRIHGR